LIKRLVQFQAETRGTDEIVGTEKIFVSREVHKLNGKFHFHFIIQLRDRAAFWKSFEDWFRRCLVHWFVTVR